MAKYKTNPKTGELEMVPGSDKKPDGESVVKRKQVNPKTGNLQPVGGEPKKS